MSRESFDSPVQGSENAFPSFGQAFLFWLKLGFISFGGPAGQIAIMHDFLVEKKKWISESRFLHALNYCMLLPGPEAQQLATYTGWLMHGVRGGLTAGILFILPSVFILTALSIVYVTYGKLAWVAAVFYGLKPAVVAIVIIALIRIARRSLQKAIHYAIAVISFFAIFFLEISFPFIVVFALAIGLVLQKIRPSLFPGDTPDKAADDHERRYIINKFSSSSNDGASFKSLLLKIVIGLFLWTMPVLIIAVSVSDFPFWMSLIGLFSKAAMITFGGAYAILPYIAQVSVEEYRWLTELQMIDGMALGETTPGPLIMILVFVGFMAAYNHFALSVSAGVMGLLTTTYYTFLPSFLFILIGAPFVERAKENIRIKNLLTIVTAAVVGVILNLTIYFGQAVLFSNGYRDVDWFALLWLVISFVAMYQFRASMILWIGVSALAGLCSLFLQ